MPPTTNAVLDEVTPVIVRFWFAVRVAVCCAVWPAVVAGKVTGVYEMGVATG